jgi:hypothetical protein
MGQTEAKGVSSERKEVNTISEALAAASNVAHMPSALTIEQARAKYSETNQQAQRQVYGMSQLQYMTNFESEIAQYSVAHMTTNKEDWTRFDDLYPPNVEYIPADMWVTVKAGLVKKYSALKKSVDDQLQAAKNLQPVEDFGQSVIDATKIIPYILIGGGILFVYSMVK